MQHNNITTMDKKEMLILIILAQATLLLGIITREYYYVQQLKTWTDAQSYCRENFVDLATIETVEDWAIVGALLETNGQNAWIGLYDDYTMWRWSMNNTYLFGNGNTQFGAWFVFLEDNYQSVEHCGCLYQGMINDGSCDLSKKSVCYDESTSKYIPATIPMTWLSAQSYCRKEYTDLTSIRNQQEYEGILSVIDQTDWWVGLFRNGWMWSDQSDSPYRQWDENQPLGGLGRCANVQIGGFNDVTCDSKFPFICSVPIMKLFKVVLKTDGSVDLNDFQVQEAVLNQIEKPMVDSGIFQKFQLSWRKQPNGKIFIQKEPEMLL